MCIARVRLLVLSIGCSFVLLGGCGVSNRKARRVIPASAQVVEPETGGGHSSGERASAASMYEALDKLADLYLANREYDKAVPVLEQRLAKAQTVLPKDSDLLPYHALDLATALDRSGQARRAAVFYAVALSQAKTTFGWQDKRVAPFLWRYGRVMVRLGEREVGESLMDQAKEVDAEVPQKELEKVFPPGIFSRPSLRLDKAGMSESIGVEMRCRTVAPEDDAQAADILLDYRLHNLTGQAVVFDAETSFRRYAVQYYAAEASPQRGATNTIVGYQLRPWGTDEVDGQAAHAPKPQEIPLDAKGICRHRSKLGGVKLTAPGLYGLSVVLYFKKADSQELKVPAFCLFIHSGNAAREEASPQQKNRDQSE